jgi:hypothetical protein
VREVDRPYGSCDILATKVRFAATLRPAIATLSKYHSYSFVTPPCKNSNILPRICTQ